LAGDSGPDSDAPAADMTSGETNPSLVTSQLDPIAAPPAGMAPPDEISAEVGGAAPSYETNESEVEVIEAKSTSPVANTNGYRDDHGQQGRRNRSRS
jgi:hypothetical protein